jgi:hypothetical protein
MGKCWDGLSSMLTSRNYTRFLDGTKKYVSYFFEEALQNLQQIQEWGVLIPGIPYALKT